MNILVTGATGFVGQHLIPYLIDKGNDVYAVVRPSTNISKVKTSKMFVFNDNIDELKDYLISNQVEGIIHLASLYLAQHKSDQIKDLVESNVYFGTAILDAAVKSKVRWFLNTGTIWQNYNVPAFSKQYCPVNLYAASKQAFIDMAKFYTEISDIKFCTLKLCDTYGPNDTRRKIYSLFEQIAKTGELLKMSPGEQKLDMVHIDQVVNDFYDLASRLSHDEILDSEYVISSGTQKSLKEIALNYEKENNVKLNIEWGGRPYRDREVMKPYIGQVLTNIKQGGVSSIIISNASRVLTIDNLVA